MAECLLNDGTRLHYQATGSGQSLLLLHGWGMSRAVFSEVEERLAPSFRCLSIDLPGHGASPVTSGFSLENLVAAVGGFIRQLQLEKPILLGWSLGGIVAQKVALQGENPLAGLVLVSTTPRFVAGKEWQAGLPELQLRALRRDLRRNYARALGEFFQLMFAGAQLPRDRFREVVRFAAGAGRVPDETSALAGLELLQRSDLSRQLHKIDYPCLVVHGTADRIIPVEAGRYLAEQIAGSELELLPEAGHAPFLDRPEQFCERIERFIHGIPGTQS